MRRQPWGLYAVAAAILVVGLVALGVPAQTLLFGAFLLACPLMMLTMHGGGHSGAMHGDRSAETHVGHGAHPQPDPESSTSGRDNRPAEHGGPR